MDFKMYGEYPPGTKSIESYWESIWNAQWDKIPNQNCSNGCDFDAKMTIYHSWLRRTMKSKQFNSFSLKKESERPVLNLISEKIPPDMF